MQEAVPSQLGRRDDGLLSWETVETLMKKPIEKNVGCIGDAEETKASVRFQERKVLFNHLLGSSSRKNCCKPVENQAKLFMIYGKINQLVCGFF